MVSKKRVVIIMGPPGSGKGTQATLLSEKLNLYYLETSKVIEGNLARAKKGEFATVSGRKYSLDQEKEKWRTGLLNTPPLVTFWMKHKIENLHGVGENLLLAGSPRTVYEAKELMPFLVKLYSKNNIQVVLIEVTAEETIFRNSHRKICELMRHPILYSPETNKLTRCALDGSKLLKRKGLDDPATIRVRLERYKEETLPVLDYLEKNRFSVKRVNGSPAPAVVFRNILKKLRA